MPLIKPWRQLPGPLWAMFVAFALLPVWSFTAIREPWEMWSTASLMQVALVTLAYWFLPILICVLIGLRSFLLIPLFWLECLALIAHSQQDGAGLAPALQLLRYLLLGLVALAGSLLLRKDILYPLLTRGNRGWRRAPRVEFNHRAQVFRPESADYVNVMIENGSLSGMAVSGSDRDLRAHLSKTNCGDKIRLRLICDAETVQLETTLAWYESRDPLVRMGLRVADEAAMALLIARLGSPYRKADAAGRLSRLWASNAIRFTLVAIWASSIGASLAIPACGRLDAADHQMRGEVASATSRETVEVRVALSLASAQRDDFSLDGDSVGYDVSVTGCASGFATTVTIANPQPLLIPLDDTGCHLVVDRIWMDGTAFSLPAGVAFVKGAKAMNTFANSGGDSLVLVTIADLPQVVKATASASFHLMETDASDVAAIVIPIPTVACGMRVAPPVSGSKASALTVLVHPAYLPYAKTLELKVCHPDGRCRTHSRTAAQIAFTNVFDVRWTEGTTASATVTLDNAPLTRQVDVQGKALACTAETKLPTNW